MVFCQSEKANYYLDPEGNSYQYSYESLKYLHLNYKGYALGFRKVKDSGMIHQINAPIYLKYTTDYKKLKDSIEVITSIKYHDSTIFIIGYNYKDDNCSKIFSNNMTQGMINERKKILNPIKRKIERKSNIVYLMLFENGIVLKNKPESEKEYFFLDKNNLFRKTLFIYPTVCGSEAIIKPKGQALIRNGEYRPDWMADHLKPDIWDKFFNNNDSK